MAAVIFNYTNYMKEHYENLYAKIIYPAIYGKEYTEPVQMDLFEPDELATDQDTIDTSNVWARTKNQFKQGNEYRFKSDD